MRPNRFLRPLLTGSLAALAITLVGFVDATAQATENPLVISLDEVGWGPPSHTPRYPQGLQTARLGVDPDNGGPIYLARFPTGTHFDLHWHTHAEYVVVVSGEGTIVLGDREHPLSVGSYVVIPEKMPHSWDVPPGASDLVILVRRRGPADFHFVDP